MNRRNCRFVAGLNRVKRILPRLRAFDNPEPNPGSVQSSSAGGIRHGNGGEVEAGREQPSVGRENDDTDVRVVGDDVPAFFDFVLGLERVRQEWKAGIASEPTQNFLFIVFNCFARFNCTLSTYLNAKRGKRHPNQHGSPVSTATITSKSRSRTISALQARRHGIVLLLLRRAFSRPRNVLGKELEFQTLVLRVLVETHFEGRGVSERRREGGVLRAKMNLLPNDSAPLTAA